MASIISAGTTSGTSLNLSADTSGVLQLATNGTTTAVTINTSQQVGIGTSSPSVPLDVQAASGDVRVRSKSNGGGGAGIFVADGNGAGSFPGYQLAQSGTNYWSIQQRGDTNLHLYRESGSGIVIVDAGSLQVATTVGVGAATPSASGAGITFPATQSASSDANTLDDYEEGTWTPTNNGDATGTITNPTGEYVKIGRMIYVRFCFQVSVNFTSGFIGGLPFTASGADSTSSVSGACAVLNSNASALFASPVMQTTTVAFYTSANTANSGGLTTTNATFRGSFVYRTSS